MSKTAMKLALEALEESLGYVEEEAENAQRLYGQYPTRQARIQGLKDGVRKHMHAITALREALADQPARTLEELYALSREVSAEQPAPVAGKKSHTSADNYGAAYETSDRAPFTDGDPSDGY